MAGRRRELTVTFRVHVERWDAGCKDSALRIERLREMRAWLDAYAEALEPRRLAGHKRVESPAKLIRLDADAVADE